MSEAAQAVEAPVVETPVSEAPEGEVNETSPESGVQESQVQEELKAELKSQIKKLKLKVDGKDVERQIDLANEAELIKLAQMAEMANKRAQEAAELRKRSSQTEVEVGQFIEALKSNPFKVLEQMGIDTKDLSEKRLQEEIKKLEMSEEEREIMELRQKLQEHEQREAAAKKQIELEKIERMKDQYAQDFERDLITAIDKSHLPKNPEVINRLAQYMATAIKLGIDISFQDIIPLVHDNLRTDMKALLGGLPIEEVLEVLGDEKIQKIMAKKMPKPAKKAPEGPKDVKDTSKPKVKEDEYGRKFKTKAMKDFFSKL